MVVDLAVVDHINARVLVRHRLVPGGRQVDEGQPAVDQLAVGVAICPVPVRAAVREQGVRALGPFGRRRQERGVEPPGYAAHGRVPPSAGLAPAASCPLARATASTPQNGFNASRVVPMFATRNTAPSPNGAHPYPLFTPPQPP